MLLHWSPDMGVVSAAAADFSGLIKNTDNTVWLDLEGDEPSLRSHLEALSLLHPLTVERIFTEEPRAFLDEFDDYIHILLQEFSYNEAEDVHLATCHCILGSNYLITVRREPLKAVAIVQNTPPARFFSGGPDILFYHIAEPLITAGFSVLDEIAELTENIEDRIFPKPDRTLLSELFDLKRDLIVIRKTLAPMREVFSLLARRENPFVDTQALPFMSMLYDQLIRLHEITDNQREIIAGALEIYLTSLSNRMNEIMMTLTIVSTIILPLTLITGFYGMNFQHFREITWPNGIPYVLLLMLAVVIAMLWYFKRKKWF